jgi:hypothetical protein
MSHDEIVILDADHPPEPGKQLCHYVALISRLAEIGVIKNGRVSKYSVGHDHWCSLLKTPGGICSCNPIINKDGREYVYAELCKSS